MAMLLALAMTVAIGISMFASAADTVTETVVVQQSVRANTTPKRSSYTYVLTPKRAENPMPDGTVNGKYTLPVITGTTTDQTAPSFTIEIDKSRPGVYEYILEKVETTPSGDTFSPQSHIFGYKVEVDEETGELVVIPYICQSGNPVFTDPDKDGYPTKVILLNTIVGTANSTKSTTTTTTTTTTKRGSGYTTRTTSRASGVNTGDESQLMMWVVILGVAVAGLLLVILIRKRHEDDDEDQI